MLRTKWIGTMGLALSLVFLSGCSLREQILKQVMQEQASYFQHPEALGWGVEKLTEKVYSFHWGFYRNLLILTSEGVVVIDPFKPKAVKYMRQALQEIAPNQPVHTLIYSHYHLDHTQGGAGLKPQRVLAHQKSPEYWKWLDTEHVLEPTQYISGDQTLAIGGVKLELFDMGRSHTDTLYALYLPEEKVLYAADMALVQSLPPLGIPDHFTPGLLAGLERLSKLDFVHFVPSHFGLGNKADFLESYQALKFVRQLCHDAVQRHAMEGPPISSAAVAVQIFDEIYYPFKARYGDWHGFEQAGLLMMIRHYVGEELGY